MKPPFTYLHETRTGTGDYKHEMSAADHQALLTALLACRASVMLSGYPSDLYDAALTGWDRLEIPTGTAQGRRWSHRTEVVWCNRPMNAQRRLFDTLAVTE